MIDSVTAASRGSEERAVNAEVDLDMAGAFAALKRHSALILGLALVTAIAVLILVNLVSPRYSGEVRVVIENRETALTRAGRERSAGTGDSLQLDAEAISSQVQIAYSRDLARSVIRDLQLNKIPEFDPMASGAGAVPAVLAFLGLGRDIARMSAEERALEAYYERLSVAPVEKSRVIEIRFWAKDAELASRVANTISERFIELQTRAKLDRDRKVRHYFELKIDELRSTVAEAEGKAQNHRSENDLLTGANNSSLGSQSLSELTAQLSNAQAQQAEAEAKSRSIRDLLKSGKPIESADVFASPLMQRLTERGAALRAEHALQTTVLLPGHPRMRELQAQLSDNQNQIRLQAERIARGLENDARTSNERMKAIQTALDGLKKNANSHGDKEVQLRALEREAKAQRDLLENWLGLYREAVARDSLEAQAADARIVSRAETSNTPVFPKKLPLVLISFFGVACIGAALVVTKALLSPHQSANSEMVRQEPDFIMPAAEQRVLADTDLSTKTQSDETNNRQDDMFPPSANIDGEWRRDLEDEQAEHRAKRQRPHAPLLQGPHAPLLQAALAGKLVLISGVTTAQNEARLAIELARGLAARGRRIVLVDAHNGDSTIASELRLEAQPGLAEIAAGSATIASAICAPARLAIHILRRGRASTETLDFSNPRLTQTMDALALTYDSIVVRAASLNHVRMMIELAGGAATIAIDAGSSQDPVALAAKRALTLPGVGQILILPRREAPHRKRRRAA